MTTTGIVIPPVAVAHRLRGGRLHRRSGPWPPPPAAVLFGRDGTLVRGVPHNGDPARVEPMPGAEDAVTLLRSAGVRLGVVSNQPGVGRGLITREQLHAVNARVDELLGPFDVWAVCAHAPDEGCACRKPAPGLVVRAAGALDARPADCVVIGDVGADVGAAHAAGARAILVPTPRTRPDDLRQAHVAPNLLAAAWAALGVAGVRPGRRAIGGGWGLDGCGLDTWALP